MKVRYYITTEAQERAIHNYHAGVLALFDAQARGPVFASILKRS